MKWSHYATASLLLLLGICLLAECKDIAKDQRHRLDYYYWTRFNKNRQRSTSCSPDAPCTTNNAIVCTQNSDCCCGDGGDAEECILYVGANCLFVEEHPSLNSGTCMVPVGC